MTIGKMAIQLADIKLWRKDLAAVDVASMSPGDFQKWVAGQLADNLAPLLEAEINAISHEVSEIGGHVDELDSVVNEIIDHEDSYLRPELAADLTGTLLMGVEICQLVVNFDPDDELGKKKLNGLMKTYQQQATAMIDEIEQIVSDEDEEEEEEENKDATTGSGLHVESGNTPGTDAGREGEIGPSGRTEPTGAPQGEGSE